MILDRLEQADRYAVLHDCFPTAFSYLRRPNLAEIVIGRHTVDGDNVFAIIEKVEGRGRGESRVEYHRQYIDIQYIVDGTDEIGWIPTEECQRDWLPYEASRDIGFFADEPSSWLTLPRGRFAIFFPQDAHAPLAGSGPLHKVVVKVAVD